MNNDILPPKRPVEPPVDTPTTPAPAPTNGRKPPVATPATAESGPATDPAATTAEEVPAPAASARNKRLKWIAAGLFAIILLGCGALFGWYQLAQRPVQANSTDKVRVTIESGSTPAQIGTLLKEKQVIRDERAFALYTRVSNTRNQLKAGTFTLSPAESMPKIVSHIVAGANDQYTVTFYPGATLSIASTAADKTPSHRQVLEKLDFSKEEIDAAFAEDYSKDYPVLFAGKPASADLEGYIYGETYQIAAGSSVKQILMRTFAEFEAQLTKQNPDIKEGNLVEAFKAHNLSVYQAITLGSIIQREVPTTADQKQVAQIFYTRLGMDMMLGSDVTYHYAADKLGVPRDHTLESPYNTRIHTGLPPGPIASPGLSSLLAVASPAQGDYVYFLSGDDDKTYFARTNAEHEANIRDHCTVKCALP
jgi:UPF0755 protein